MWGGIVISGSERGLLIINADDLGYDEAATNAILHCFGLGAITSASAMVFMEDSRRAAELANAAGIPAGLHLNLLEPFTEAVAPPAVKVCQADLCRHFASGARRWLFDPAIRSSLRATIGHQLDEFVRLYGREPDHFDGHQHMHLSLNVLLEPGPLAAFPARRSFSFARGEKSPVNRAWRELTSAVIRRRFGSTERFYSVTTLVPGLGGAGLDGVLATSREAAVEIMVHPALSEERDILEAEEWRAALRGLPLGTYADIAR